MSPDFLLEMAWKSALLVLTGLALVLLMRHRPASERSLVLRLTVLLLLLLPVAALFGPRLAVEQPGIMADLAPAAAPAPMPRPAAAEPATVLPIAPTSPALPWQALLIAAYGLGVGIVLSRLVAGVLILRRWTRAARPLVHPLWGAAYDRALLRAGVRRRKVALLLSRQTPSPLGWGLRRPAILIDPATAARDEQAEAVLAHEMAHVARGDWPALIASRLALALFWFNPLVWLLDRRLSEQAEEAADMHAIRRIDPAAYAQTLLNCAAPGALALPANPMVANSDISRRIMAVLDEGARDRAARSRPASIATALACAAVLASAAAIAAVEVRPRVAAIVPSPVSLPTSVEPASAVSTPTEVAAVSTADAAAWPAPAPAPAPERAAMPDPLGAVVAEAVANPPAPPAPPPAPVAPLSPPTPPGPASPVAAAAPIAPVSPVPPVHVRVVKMPKITRESLLQSMGVTEAYVTAMATAFGIRIDEDEVVSLKALGVTPEQVRDWRAAGLRRLSVDDATQLAVLRIKADYVAGMRQAGLGDISVDDLSELRAMGISPEFAARARREGRAESVDELVEYKALGWR
ncbi:M56 family metallopeptidase [Sandaracinobacter neustonicus]|uniref:M56 family metallopeptidase n=1 Tax=Sandaracinobacter neustonicus TaxID=1715348 RepID=A0A501XNJ8_9SPHN|nr:M56 family metallopeptidase [Sandaracinobacter neustonicus]TPE61727.1 M56 family metallopeptidase [Sandaracinobacter neustonicus]